MQEAIRVGTDCSGIEAPIQALKRLGVPFSHLFSSDIDKHVKKVITELYKPELFYDDLMDRDNTLAPEVDLYVAGFPCQAFSIAGARKGFDDVRGTVFFGCADYIRQKRPKYFLLENVKGLLSDDSGRTFQTITDLLSNGGGTVNGQMSMDFFEDGLGYHIYHAVLNSKDYGIPQNRERVFIVGFRSPQNFTFPPPEILQLTLGDLLEPEVHAKYAISESAMKSVVTSDKHQKSQIDPDIAQTLQSPGHSAGIYKGMNAITFTPLQPDGIARTIRTGGKSTATDKHNWDIVQVGTLRTHKDGEGFREIKDGTCPTIPARAREDGSGQPVVKMMIPSRTHEGKLRGRNESDVAGTVHGSTGKGGNTDQFVKQSMECRRLTPLECFRLQDFPDDFCTSVQKLGISDSQMYKMAGNSMTVAVIHRLLRRMLEQTTT